MGWFILTQLFSILIQLIRIGRMSNHEKDLKIMILRYQLDLAERKQHTPLKSNRAEKLTLAVLVTKFKQHTQRPTNQLRDLVRLFQPETVLHWHRQLIRRKWTYDQYNKGGRPPLDHKLEALVVRLDRHEIVPAPRRVQKSHPAKFHSRNKKATGHNTSSFT